MDAQDGQDRPPTHAGSRSGQPRLLLLRKAANQSYRRTPQDSRLLTAATFSAQNATTAPHAMRWDLNVPRNHELVAQSECFLVTTQAEHCAQELRRVLPADKTRRNCVNTSEIPLKSPGGRGRMTNSHLSEDFQGKNISKRAHKNIHIDERRELRAEKKKNDEFHDRTLHGRLGISHLHA